MEHQNKTPNKGTPKQKAKSVQQCVKSSYWRRSAVFIVNFEQISQIVLVFPLLILNKCMRTG